MATTKRRSRADMLDPEVLRQELDRLTSQVTKKTEQEVLEETVMAELARLGGQRVTDDSIVQEGTRLVLPATMTPHDAVDFLHQYIEAQETPHTFTKTFRFRPLDGAAAFERALRRVFGNSGIGRPTWTFFGKIPPALISVDVGLHESIQVPQGEIEVPSFEGTIELGQTRHRELGHLFQITITCPRKYKANVEGLFKVIEEELHARSIYKGKAIDGQTVPEFLDLSGVNPAEVVYADEVLTQLEANLWSVAKHTETLRSMNIPRKRAVLLEGPYGTGKTLAAFLTAQVCVSAPEPWTFLYCRPARDNISDVMAMARLYQPAMVFFEDVDVIAEGGDNDAITKLLDLFDGIQAKGTEIVVVLTTNHKERIHKAMVRPGRLDAMVHIGALDRNGIERLIRVTVPTDILSDDVDYDAVFEAMKGFLPAFAKEATDRAMRYAITRAQGVPEVMTTEDFVEAAQGLRPQLELMENAGEGKPPTELSEAMSKLINQQVDGTVIHDYRDRDTVRFALATETNGHNGD